MADTTGAMRLHWPVQSSGCIVYGVGAGTAEPALQYRVRDSLTLTTLVMLMVKLAHATAGAYSGQDAWMTTCPLHAPAFTCQRAGNAHR